MCNLTTKNEHKNENKCKKSRITELLKLPHFKNNDSNNHL